MKKTIMMCLLLLSGIVGANAQTAQSVLDKCAAALKSKGGVKADFTMESAKYGNASGSVSIKGNRFHVSTGAAAMWFDGKTQWTYMKKNNEVNISTPTAAKQQNLNPYHFISIYKGYKSSLTTSGSAYRVHLTTSDAKKSIAELFLTIDKKTYMPTEIKIRQGQKWTTFTLRHCVKANLSDKDFAFPSKDYPKAEIIDLR